MRWDEDEWDGRVGQRALEVYKQRTSQLNEREKRKVIKLTFFLVPETR